MLPLELLPKQLGPEEQGGEGDEDDEIKITGGGHWPKALPRQMKERWANLSFTWLKTNTKTI